MLGIQPHWSETIETWAREQPLVLAIYAFGSRVKGGYTTESDLDVAIEVAGSDDGEKFGNAIFLIDRWEAELQALLPVRLHLQHMMADDEVVAPAVREHGLLLYQAP